MTLDQMMLTDKPMLTPEEISDVVGCMPYTINLQAKEDASRLGFPVCMIGTRVRIPRMAFIHWMTYGPQQTVRVVIGGAVNAGTGTNTAGTDAGVPGTT